MFIYNVKFILYKYFEQLNMLQQPTDIFYNVVILG